MKVRKFDDEEQKDLYGESPIEEESPIDEVELKIKKFNGASISDSIENTKQAEIVISALSNLISMTKEIQKFRDEINYTLDQLHELDIDSLSDDTINDIESYISDIIKDSDISFEISHLDNWVRTIT